MTNSTETLKSQLTACVSFLNERGVKIPRNLHGRIYNALKKARDRRTAQGKAEKELEAELMRLFQEGGETAAEAIRAGAYPSTSELTKRLQALLLQKLLSVAEDEALDALGGVGIGFDPAAIDSMAEEWARSYSYDLVKGIEENTRKVLQDAINAFTNTPGMTNADLFDMLAPAFGEVRAQMIAITEVTRAYAQGEAITQGILEGYGLDTVRVWITSGDERVCPICGGLDRQEAPINEPFEHPETGEIYDNPPAHPNCRCATAVEVKIGN